MNKTSKKFSFSIFLTFCLVVTSIGLVAHHTNPHCKLKSNGTELNDCPDLTKDFCQNDAPALKFRSVTHTTETEVACNWRTATQVIAFISLILSLFLIIMFAFMACGRPLRWSICVMVSIVIPALILTFGLMIGDINVGFNYFKNNTQGGDYIPASYVANLIMIMLTTVMFGSLTLVGCRMQKGEMLEIDTTPTVKRNEKDKLNLKEKVRKAHMKSESHQYGYALNTTMADLNNTTRILDSTRIHVYPNPNKR